MRSGKQTLDSFGTQFSGKPPGVATASAPRWAQVRIEILSEAENDLLAGANFYKRRCAGLGEYFLDSLYSDIDSLLLYAGVDRERALEG